MVPSWQIFKSVHMQPRIAVIGLGYVGLPLARLLATKYPVAGFDINEKRVAHIQTGEDKNLEVDPALLRRVLLRENPLHKGVNGLYCSSAVEDIRPANVYIVTVPTPIDSFNKPDLSSLKKASAMIGGLLKKGDIVVYESTVYPGCTEEVCVPELEQSSGLRYNVDFFCGYSPERINPGDKVNTIEKIKKITSGSTKIVAEKIDQLYASVITAGTYKASSIKVAEAAKGIENAQRDLNISFMNELALIFDRLDVDTNEVIEAASTKWNFIKFRPGLVGGHCISVDPYYLVHKAEAVGYYPEVILSGRKVNDQMPLFVANKLVKLMIAKGMAVNKSRVLILGFSFKENCPDFRNTKIIDVYRELQEFGVKVDVYDPWVSSRDVYTAYGIELLPALSNLEEYNGIILAVAHNDFMHIDWAAVRKSGTVVFDVKSVLNRELVDGRL